MKAFARRHGSFVAHFEPDEAALLTSLAEQLTEVLRAGSDGAATTDPAVLRLLPDAYPDDAEASGEFRRFTAEGLTDRKLSNAARVVADLAAAVAAETSTRVELDEASAQAWMRSLTDLRLTIGVRLGIETETDFESPAESLDPLLLDIYDWLSFVLESLVESVDR